jgi:metal-responsive CopG/Arc/MetJ family transcriptional regulator
MPRTQTTIRLEEQLIEDLDSEAEEKGISRSEYIRQILRERGKSEELREEIDTLMQRLESREERIEELEEQLARRSQVEEKIDTLVKRQSDENAPFFVKWYNWWNERD